MNCDKIGEVSGLIWSKLRDVDEGCTVAQLKKITGYTGDEIVAGIGWLAREGKVEFHSVGKRVFVSLAHTEQFV